MRFRGLGLLLIGITLIGLSLSFSPTPAIAQTEVGTPGIVFVTRDSDAQTMTLSMVDPNTGGVLTLVDDGFFYRPTWSPDGRQLAFIGRGHPSDRPVLWVMNSDGSNLHPVLPPGRTAPHPECAVWSPDGTQLLFGTVNAISALDFYTVNVDGSNLEQLSFPGIPGTMEGIPGDIVDQCASWSPDGSQIALLARGDGFPPGQLYISTADGISAVPFPAVTANGTTFHRLAWSPDGQKVLLYEFPGMAPGMDSKPMAIASADGSTIEAWVGAPPNLPGSAAWSPDSSQIVFVANEQDVDTIPGGDLWMSNADGSNVRTLNIAADVADLGTSWALIPADVTLPSAPVSLDEAAG